MTPADRDPFITAIGRVFAAVALLIFAAILLGLAVGVWRWALG